MNGAEILETGENFMATANLPQIIAHETQHRENIRLRAEIKELKKRLADKDESFMDLLEVK